MSCKLGLAGFIHHELDLLRKYASSVRPWKFIRNLIISYLMTCRLHSNSACLCTSRLSITCHINITFLLYYLPMIKSHKTWCSRLHSTIKCRLDACLPGFDSATVYIFFPKADWILQTFMTCHFDMVSPYLHISISLSVYIYDLLCWHVMQFLITSGGFRFLRF